MDEEILDYLASERGTIPPIGPMVYAPERGRIIGSDGIVVSQNYDRSITQLALDDRFEQQIADALANQQGDPLANISFRVAYTPTTDTSGSVTVKPGFLSYTKWGASGAWEYVEYETTEETALVTSLPAYIYLKVPMMTHSSTVDGADAPFGTFNGTATIEGTDYLTQIEYSTEWTGPVEASLLNMVESRAEPFPTSSSTEYRFILATIDEDGNVEQHHFSGVTIPQAFNPLIVSFTIL